jgi:hypothetical protein
MGGSTARPQPTPPKVTSRPVVIATTPSDKKLPPVKVPAATPRPTEFRAKPPALVTPAPATRRSTGGLIAVDSSALLKTFASYVGIKESPMGSNNGPMVDKFNASCGLRPSDHAPWCAAVAHYGYLVNGAPDRPGAYSPSWYAKSRVTSAKDVRPGDVGLIYFPSKGRYAHTITAIEKVNWSGRVVASYVTLEGNSNRMGSREGDQFCRRIRPADTVTVVRWN